MMHHGHAARFVEGFFLCISSIKRGLPYSLKVNGIQQVTYCKGVELVFSQYFLNHLVGIVAGPFIDYIPSFAIVKVASLRIGIIILVDGMREIVL